MVNVRRSSEWAAFVLLPLTFSLCVHADERAPAKAHPLDPACRLAEQAMAMLEQVRDYSGIMVKRERVKGKIGGHEYCFLKVRHEPFSVYMKFLKPQDVMGREAIYVEGRNDGKMLAHTPALDKLGTAALAPDGLIAMRGQRHPITQLGVKKLTAELKERFESERREQTPEEASVKIFIKAKVNNRSATIVEIVQAKRIRSERFHRIRVYFDDELKFPVRFEGYDWPKNEKGQPPLVEEYTYMNLKLNNRFTDVDFDMKNPKYNFPKMSLGSLPFLNGEQ